ncbi:hypothetical protein HZP84_13100 [Elizabethkingia anophelis]|uniref:Lipoprotein n=1 Tax=Elizabethkingia anophelis TaxID=1117645 RepID=A0AAU8USY2_9FLAO|nr:hypothetical protein [Elizabethkingia anophelis]AQX00537.1 hypothetical protein BBD32_03195 [Elizabethkingia anophelis]KGT10350.1 hypothetical protein NV63_00010 [Elizabethkingia anophelis]MCT3692183.1 hypothetical protein [Elizabethkingia anophelis]MCT3764393.1 hypothetical protein [Elizabethkingia anophelis]MCT3823649.1 hypothetical protein [Elizabethkingia anophelis]
MRIINYISALIIISLLLIACQKKIVSEGFVRKLAKIDNKNVLNVPENATNYLYVCLDNNKIFVTNVLELYDWYSNYQDKSKDFYTFLDNVLNQRFKLKSAIATKYEYQSFTVNPNIMRASSESITEKYFEQNESKEKYYFYPKSLSADDTQTILYKMFLEGYLISFDDYAGSYIVKKYQSK